MNINKHGIRKRIKSFGYAFAGLLYLVKAEPNARIHLVATIVAIALSIFFKISAFEWMIILIVIGLVWAMEAINTAIEKLSDHLFPETNETARIAKDVAAGAVLVCALVALACGAIIFLPKIVVVF